MPVKTLRMRSSCAESDALMKARDQAIGAGWAAGQRTRLGGDGSDADRSQLSKP